MNFIWWLLFGLIAGAIAKALRPGKDPGGFIVTIIIGMIGAVVGGVVGNAMGFGDVTGFNFRSFALAVVGAIIVLAIYHWFATRRSTN